MSLCAFGVTTNDPRNHPRATHRKSQVARARAVRSSERARLPAGAAEVGDGRSRDAGRAGAGEGAEAQAARDRGAALERTRAPDFRGEQIGRATSELKSRVDIAYA